MQPGPSTSGQCCQPGEQDSAGSWGSLLRAPGVGLSWLLQLHEEVLDVIVEAAGA